MSTLRVPVEAYILGLLPQSNSGRPARGNSLRPLVNGLAVPSFWNRTEINEAFAGANEIWKRGADIEFTPVNISARTECVPADENGMWVHFVQNLRPRGPGIGVGFLYDLPSIDGGWGGGRVVVLSGLKASSGLAGFAGRLLAHELGHVLTSSPAHSTDPSNLMFDAQNPRQVNAGMLTEDQARAARARAVAI